MSRPTTLCAHPPKSRIAGQRCGGLSRGQRIRPIRLSLAVSDRGFDDVRIKNTIYVFLTGAGCFRRGDQLIDARWRCPKAGQSSQLAPFGFSGKALLICRTYEHSFYFLAFHSQDVPGWRIRHRFEVRRTGCLRLKWSPRFLSLLHGSRLKMHWSSHGLALIAQPK
jgi:hypothetical protein